MKQYVVDAFTEKVFSGNPAAICVMDSWLDDDLMMKITIENNLSETAFAVKENDKYKLRCLTPKEAYMGRDLLCILNDEEDVKNLKPDMDKLKQIDGLLFHVSAPGKYVDCVSRSFAPKLNVIEDPVCGSGHCHIAPYWINKLNKDSVIAYQASRRGGTLYCSMDKDKVKLSGKAALFSVADINIK